MHFPPSFCFSLISKFSLKCILLLRKYIIFKSFKNNTKLYFWIVFDRILRHCSWYLKRSHLLEQRKSYWRGQKDWPNQSLKIKKISYKETSTLSFWDYGNTGNLEKLEIKFLEISATEVQVYRFLLKTMLLNNSLSKNIYTELIVMLLILL